MEENSAHQQSVFVDSNDALDTVLMFNNKCNNSTFSQHSMNKKGTKYNEKVFDFSAIEWKWIGDEKGRILSITGKRK